MAYRDQGPYGQSRQDQGNPYSQRPYGDVELGQGFQMSDMHGGGGSSQPSQGISSFSPEILNECQEIDAGITKLQNMFSDIERKQKQSLSSTEPLTSEVDALIATALDLNRTLKNRIRQVKTKPKHLESSNKPQVDRVERRLKAVMHEFNVIESAFIKEKGNEVVRHLRIIYPDASEEELRELARNRSNAQIFSSTLMNGNRRQDVNDAMRNVQGRHQDIQKLERAVIEIVQIAAELNAQVSLQEPVVAQINEQSEVVHQNVDQANHQLDGAIKSAKAANRKKWYCLGIAALIIIIIIIIVVIVVKVVLNK